MQLTPHDRVPPVTGGESTPATASGASDEADWLCACRQVIKAAGLPLERLRPLAAFGAGPERPAGTAIVDIARAPAGWLRETSGDFAAWEQAALAVADDLQRVLRENLSAQMTRERVQDFARRLGDLLRGLGSLGSIEARVLRLGLLVRLSEVLAQPERRSSRVRDVIDFYFSQASLLVHRRPGLATLGELVHTVAWRPIAPGIEHGHLEGLSSAGPVHLNLLRARGVRLRMRHGGPCDTLGEVPAAISGGYLLASHMDIEPPSRHGEPVGLLVQDGVVESPPVFRRACLLEGPGGIEIRIVGPIGLEVHVRGRAWTVMAHNDPAAITAGPVAFNRVYGPCSPPHGGLSLALLGRRVIRVGPGAIAIPKAGLVLTLPPAPLGVDAERLLDADVEYRLPGVVSSAVAAGPMLLGEGDAIDLGAEEFFPVVPPYTFAADETLDQNLLPRMVAGLTGAGELILAAIDGRHFTRGVGMTLGQCRELLAALGCTRGMNLDGGDSKRMFVHGRVVDLPGSQLEWGERDTGPLAEIRSVYSAILLLPEPVA